MKVFADDDTYDDRFPATSKVKRTYKTTEGGIQIMCNIIRRNREEAAKEAEFKGRISSAKAIIKAGLTTFEALKSSGIYTKEELAAIQA